MRRSAFYAGAVLTGAVGVLLIGIALLIAAATPHKHRPAGWALFVVPSTPFLVAIGLIFAARSKPIESAFGTLKEQLQADKALLSEVSAP